MKKPSHFIVVDDNRTNNLICEYVIRKFMDEAKIDSFTEPKVALEHIGKEYIQTKNEKLTVLFLDINMPLMTGWEFLEEFRNFSGEIHRQFVIYILTSSVDERDKEKADADPLVIGFYSKPLTVQSIQQVLDRLQN